MEIRIETEDGPTFVFSDSVLDNDNYVAVRIEHANMAVTEKDELPVTAYEDVLLDDLFAACIAFDSKRNRRISRENPNE